MHLGSLGLRALRWRVLLRPIADGAGAPAAAAAGDRLHGQLPLPGARRGGRAGLAARPRASGSARARPSRPSSSSASSTAWRSSACSPPRRSCSRAGDPVLMARIRWGAPLLPAAYVAVLGALILLGHHREALAAFLARHPPVQRRPLLAAPGDFVERFCEGLAVLTLRQVAIARRRSRSLIWGWGGLANLLMMRAFGLDLPAYAPFLLLVLQAVGVPHADPGASSAPSSTRTSSRSASTASPRRGARAGAAHPRRPLHRRARPRLLVRRARAPRPAGADPGLPPQEERSARPGRRCRRPACIGPGRPDRIPPGRGGDEPCLVSA